MKHAIELINVVISDIESRDEWDQFDENNWDNMVLLLEDVKSIIEGIEK